MINMPLHFRWTAHGELLQGYDAASGDWIARPLSFGQIFPGSVTAPLAVSLATSALAGFSYQTMTQVAVSLPEPAPAAYTAQISFDHGFHWLPLSTTPLPVAASALNRTGTDGTLGPYDEAFCVCSICSLCSLPKASRSSSAEEGQNVPFSVVIMRRAAPGSAGSADDANCCRLSAERLISGGSRRRGPAA